MHTTVLCTLREASRRVWSWRGVGLVILLANVSINGHFKEGITLKVYKLGNRNKSPIAKIKNVKSVQWGPSCSCRPTDRTHGDMTKLIFAFRISFSNVPKN